MEMRELPELRKVRGCKGGAGLAGSEGADHVDIGTPYCAGEAGHGGRKEAATGLL